MHLRFLTIIVRSVSLYRSFIDPMTYSVAPKIEILLFLINMTLNIHHFSLLYLVT